MTFHYNRIIYVLYYIIYKNRKKFSWNMVRSDLCFQNKNTFGIELLIKIFDTTVFAPHTHSVLPPNRVKWVVNYCKKECELCRL